jgi:redox-sensitive bicupin YhaK (pirin superfamily)
MSPATEGGTAIELSISPRERAVGTGTVRRLLPFRTRRTVGPFVFLDIMGPEDLAAGKGMNIDAHPHIGLSTLTYLLRGRAVHRDSIGSVQAIEPGAVNWMTAGDGVTHTERSHPDDVDRTTELFGVQIWVALPDGAEDGPATFEHCAAHDVPEATVGGARIRLPAGSAWGLDAPITGSSPLTFAEIRLDASAGLRLPAAHPERAVLALDGDVRIDGTRLGPGSLAVLARNSRPTLSGTGTALHLGGEQVGTRHIWWNFVHSDLDRIEDAKQRWLAQEFPTVPDDHTTYVPLPQSGG